MSTDGMYSSGGRLRPVIRFVRPSGASAARERRAKQRAAVAIERSENTGNVLVYALMSPSLYEIDTLGPAGDKIERAEKPWTPCSVNIDSWLI